MQTQSKDVLLSLIRLGKPMTLRQQIILTAKLSAPAMLAQLSSIVMQYIDASMLGRLGTNEAASVGLVSTTIWLFGGLGFAISSGFSVQVAHLIGANDYAGARNVLRQAIVTSMLLALGLGALGFAISPHLPLWLGADSAISGDASLYFMVFAAAYPFLMLFYLSSAMLRSCGNMKVPSILSIALDLLDVVFNFLLIFPNHHISIAGVNITLPGADLGVLGASLGSALAFAVIGTIMICYVWRRSPDLNLTRNRGSFRPTAPCLKRAFKIGMPLGIERIVMCGAQIAITAIVAPLGAVAIAANTFGITAESLCYMPGYGISDAATTLVGQSIGARRNDLTRRFAAIALSLGIVIMTLTGAVMYAAAPLMMRLMTPDPNIIALGSEILRIEAFAEPMFAASIVCYGIFVGAGDTLAPSIMNFASIWLVRLTLACALVPSMGLKGVWIAMCIELCFRGIIFLSRLRFGKWNKPSEATQQQLTLS
ncbi:MAG: MATE family efflux transporter [Muribaculaceae bacterium]